jgi:glycerol kinase
VIYHRDGEDAVYGLEGSIAVTGSLIQWLRDGLGVIGSAAESESLALSVPDSGGVCIVPAFSGLYAPYWRGDVRGTVIGLTHHSTAAHLVRASLESCAFQTYDLIGAANADTSIPLDALRVDGGMTRNEILMQFQADLLGVPVSRSATIEMAALGVSYAAGLAVGFWRDLVEVRALWTEGGRFEPSMSETNRSRELARWNRALAATFAGADPDPV